MRKSTLVALALILGLLAGIPAFAVESSTDADLIRKAIEAPLVTQAAAKAELPDFLKPFEAQIMPCEPEQEACCPPQCGCMIINNMISCVGTDPVCQAHTD